MSFLHSRLEREPMFRCNASQLVAGNKPRSGSIVESLLRSGVERLPNPSPIKDLRTYCGLWRSRRLEEEERFQAVMSSAQKYPPFFLMGNRGHPFSRCAYLLASPGDGERAPGFPYPLVPAKVLSKTACQYPGASTPEKI